MLARPFPLPLGIGTDIVSVQRLKELVRKHGLLQKWLRRTTNRLEYPYMRFLSLRALRSLQREGSSPWNLEDYKSTKYSRSDWDSPYSIADLTHVIARARAEPIGGPCNAALDQLAFKLATRWAAKEAAIKGSIAPIALTEVSIISAEYNLLPGDDITVNSSRPVALIDPPSTWVFLKPESAIKRGLYAELRKADSTQKPARHIYNGELCFRRRAKIEGSCRQSAELSMSHEEAYAVASCIVPHADRYADEKEDKQDILDNGVGPDKHEPIWGDLGWSDKSLGDFLSAIHVRL